MCYKFITHSAPFLFFLFTHKINIPLYMNKWISWGSSKGMGEQNFHKKIHLIVSYSLSTVISSNALETVSTALNYCNTSLCWQFWFGNHSLPFGIVDALSQTEPVWQDFSSFNLFVLCLCASLLLCEVQIKQIL